MNMAHFRGTSLATKCSVPARDYSYRRPGTKTSQAIMGHISTAKFASPEAERHGPGPDYFGASTTTAANRYGMYTRIRRYEESLVLRISYFSTVLGQAHVAARHTN